jgi:transposase-like protein
MARNKMLVAQVLAKYQRCDLTTEEIAAKHGISMATTTVWAKKAGLPLRKRGRRARTKPTPRQREIITLASMCNYDEVGAQFGMCKQSVRRLMKRWSHWRQTSTPPFAPGGVLFWKGKKLTVLDASYQEETLVDEIGRIYRHFIWSAVRTPTKIDVNPNVP